MVTVAQINIIVADLERSHAFYELLGLTFRGRNRLGEGPAEAWVSTNTGTTVVLHSTALGSKRPSTASAQFAATRPSVRSG